MNRILILLASLLVVGNVYGHWEMYGGTGWNTFDQKDYESGCHQAGCVLVSDDDGRWFFYINLFTGNYSQGLAQKLLYQCKLESSIPSTCRIIDEHLESDFIKSGISKPPRAKPAPSPTPSTDSGGESESAPTTVAKPNEVEEPATTLKQKLLLLRSLVDQGLITEEDYNQAKKKILDNM